MTELSYTDYVGHLNAFKRKKRKYDNSIKIIDKLFPVEPFNVIATSIVNILFPKQWRNAIYSDKYYIEKETFNNKKIYILGKEYNIVGIANAIHGQYFITDDNTMISCETPYKIL